MSLGGRVSPWRSAVEEGRSPLGRFRKPEPCFPRTYATWDAKKDENRFGSVKFRLSLAPPSAAAPSPAPVSLPPFRKGGVIGMILVWVLLQSTARRRSQRP